MSIGSAIAIYFVIWWTTLFATLPFGMRSQIDDGHVVEGTDPAAPTNPQLLKRVLWNTLVSGLIFFAYWLVFYGLGYSLDDVPDVLGVS